MVPSVLVIGAGGNFGAAVMEHFIKQISSFSQVGILTDPTKKDKFEKYKEYGIKIVLGSYFDPTVYSGYEVVISLAGNAIMKDQPGMIDAAASGGARHFYPSEYGLDLSPPGIQNVRYFRDKLITRKHISETAKNIPGFRYTLLLQGSFTEWAVSKFFGVDSEEHTIDIYGGSADALINNTACDDAARYLVSSILIPWKDASNPERTIRVAGDTNTWRQLVDAFGEMNGVVYEYRYIDPAFARGKEAEAREAGDLGKELAWSAKPLSTSGYSVVGRPLDNHLFDFKPETVKETFQRLYGKK